MLASRGGWMDRLLVRGHGHRRGAAYVCKVPDTVQALQQSFGCLCLALT